MLDFPYTLQSTVSELSPLCFLYLRWFGLFKKWSLERCVSHKLCPEEFGSTFYLRKFYSLGCFVLCDVLSP
jgi:hypothetical protein